MNEMRGSVRSRVLAAAAFIYLAYAAGVFAVALPFGSDTRVALWWPLAGRIDRSLTSEEMVPFILSHLVVVSCKCALLLLATDLITKKRVSQYLSRSKNTEYMASLLPFALVTYIAVSIIYVEGRLTYSLASVLGIGMGNVLLLAKIADSRTSRLIRVACSLPCWAFWYIWLNRRAPAPWGYWAFLILFAVALYALSLRQNAEHSVAVPSSNG